MIDVYVTFENAEQIRLFRKKLIRDFQCLDVHCHSCKVAEICEIMTRFLDDLGTAELKYNATRYRKENNND